MNLKALELELQEKGLIDAPRITPQDILDNIAEEYYFTADDGVMGSNTKTNIGPGYGSLSLLTFCVLVLNNGFTVTGESACVSAENFDAEIGRKIAKQNAMQKIWPLLGYCLREKLHGEKAQ